jgi:hypothetical protein
MENDFLLWHIKWMFLRISINRLNYISFKDYVEMDA